MSPPMKTTLILLICIFPLNCIASSDHPTPPCELFHIQISNRTAFPCYLTEQSVSAGFFLNSPPLSIMLNDSKEFIMDSTYYGSGVSLGYQCGPENIRFISTLTTYTLIPDVITGSVSPPLPTNLEASYKIYPSSIYTGHGGIIDWVLTEKPGNNVATM
jgi:hypothetical protein